MYSFSIKLDVSDKSFIKPVYRNPYSTEQFKSMMQNKSLTKDQVHLLTQQTGNLTNSIGNRQMPTMNQYNPSAIRMAIPTQNVANVSRVEAKAIHNIRKTIPQQYNDSQNSEFNKPQRQLPKRAASNK